MTYLDLPERPEPRVSPQFFVGAASPLWGYFGAAAAGGVAFWWMTRWARPVNLEALFGATPGVEGLMEEAVEAVEAAVEGLEPLPDVIAEAGVEAKVEAEAFEPAAEVVEAAPEPVVEAAPVAEAEPVLDAAPEPAAEALPDSVAETQADETASAAAKPRSRKAPSPAPES